MFKLLFETCTFFIISFFLSQGPRSRNQFSSILQLFFNFSLRSLLSFLLSYYYFKRYRCRLDYEDDVFKNDKILFYLSQKGIILYFFKIQFIIQIVNFFISFYSMQIKFSFPFLLIHRSFIYRCIYNFGERVDRERFIHFFLPMILQINYLSKYKNIIKKKKKHRIRVANNN